MTKRRIVLIAVCLIASLFFAERYVLQPRIEEIRDSIEREAAALDKYQRILKHAPPGDAELAKLEALVKISEKRLVGEASEQLASARIQARVSELAQKTGFAISTIKPANAVKRDSYRQVPVYFEGSGNIKQVSELLKAVEEDTTLLHIDRLGITITSMQNPKELKMKFQVSGLMKP